MKDLELKLISELLKNSRRSDRELAKVLGVSQPTVSRVLKKLEQQCVIEEYTMIPDFSKLGYELMALTFTNMRPTLDSIENGRARGAAQKLVREGPSSIIMLEEGMGLNHTGVIISFHKSYSDYAQSVHLFKQAPTTQAFVDESVESFLIDLRDKMRYCPLAFSALANCISRMNEKKE